MLEILIAAGLPLMAAHEVAWQDNWLAVDRARREARAAFDRWRAAEAAFFACPVWQARARRVRMPEPCDCHGPEIAAAHEAFVAAKALVDPAVAVFKAGVRPDQVPDALLPFLEVA